MKRPAHWTIEEASGQVEVWLGRKRKHVTDTEASAIAFVRTRRKDGQKVVVVEPDGYRMDITRRFTAPRGRA